MVNGMGLWNWAYHISLRCNIKYPHRNPGSVLDLSICCPILRGSMGNSSAGEGQSMSANSPSKFLELSHVIYSWRSGLWLVGGLEHGRSPSFFRGVGIPPTSIIYNYIYIYASWTSQSTNIPIHQHPNQFKMSVQIGLLLDQPGSTWVSRQVAWVCLTGGRQPEMVQAADNARDIGSLVRLSFSWRVGLEEWSGCGCKPVQ